MTRAHPTVAVIGGGPAGLMAAEILSARGIRVTIYDRMPSLGRKLLMAGRGGLNLTHSEPIETFLRRYGRAADALHPALEAFPPSALIAWANGLGQETFVGSSGRVFPKAMKASPLLRAWLARLAEQGVQFRARHTWRGWDESGALVFLTPHGAENVQVDATLLALGGASWPRLGSDGGWQSILAERDVQIVPLAPANCGFTVSWSQTFQRRFAGTPLKNIALKFDSRTVRGELMLTSYGIEGGAVYALSAPLRDAITERGPVQIEIDLRPEVGAADLARRLQKPRGKKSLSNFLRKSLHLSPVEINLLREAYGSAFGPDPAKLPAQVKSVPLTLSAAQPIARAISSAGGVAFSGLDVKLMLRAVPGVYVAGEMLDWEAPTGGYLLQAVMATGAFAAQAILRRFAL
ncbi:MAG: NAD(P)/FAD-dependent oxidoreductase [Rhizomicrobium sp.]